MGKLRKSFERFCFRHRDKGIPNLMLYIVLGTAVVNIMCLADKSNMLYWLLCFDRAKILQGEVWRLFSYVFTYSTSSIFLTAVSLVCYFSLGRAIENLWGTLRFNLFYFTGVILMDIYGLITGCDANVYYLNLSLFLSYATLYPNAQFLLLFIIPVKAWVFAVFDLVVTLLDVLVYPFPYNLFPLVALANYFLFFGKDVVNVFPISWRANFARLFRKRKKAAPGAKTIPFPTAGSYEATTATVKAPYTHRCTICGRTDISNPELEFRYCSRCNGYFCYCEEHISTHTHVL